MLMNSINDVFSENTCELTGLGNDVENSDTSKGILQQNYLPIRIIKTVVLNTAYAKTKRSINNG